MIRNTLLIAAAALLFVGAAQADIVSDLQEYWTLDGNANAALNATFNATFTGDTETYVGGKFGQGIDLERDGALDYLTVGGVGNEFDNVAGSVSISLWFTTESLATQWQAIVASGEGSAWRIARNNNTTGAAYAGGVGDISGGDISTAGFHHIVAISEAGVETRLWVDGVKVSTGGVPNLTSDGNDDAPIMIGNNPDNTGRAWDGIIDDVAIWSTALSDAEVASIWNGGAGASIASLVPEPATMFIMMAAGLPVLLKRKRKSR
ncbi:MAG: PEP-CTERM sorting domain-containing protein [Phycisphaerales bacterium]|jgi:hypothetical protein|nr:PEP-CTERM sorting domain-containing protein [Phycisphaerales bacterium]